MLNIYISTNWRETYCNEPLFLPATQLRYWNPSDGLNEVVFVRDDFPGAEIALEMDKTTGPLVVLDGSVSYTVHFRGTMPAFNRFTVPGLDQ